MSIVYIGMVRYKELYYDTESCRFRAYDTDIASASGEEAERKRGLMDLILNAGPVAGSLAAIIAYTRLRTLSVLDLGASFSVPLYVILSAVIGGAPAFVLARLTASVHRAHFLASGEATTEEAREAAQMLGKDNRLYNAALAIMALAIIGIPFFIREIATPVVFFGYAVIWFMMCLILMVFRPWERWAAMRQIRRNGG